MNDELKQRVIDEILALSGVVDIPADAITVRDLMKDTDAKKGMSESSAYRLLRKLYAEGKLQRARGLSSAYYYWPVEE